MAGSVRIFRVICRLVDFDFDTHFPEKGKRDATGPPETPKKQRNMGATGQLASATPLGDQPRLSQLAPVACIHIRRR